MLYHEQILLRALCFDLTVAHPYELVVRGAARLCPTEPVIQTPWDVDDKDPLVEPMQKVLANAAWDVLDEMCALIYRSFVLLDILINFASGVGNSRPSA